MKIFLFILASFPSILWAANNIRFTDTEIKFAEPVDFQLMSDAGAFTSQTAQGKVTIVRKSSPLTANLISLNRMWKDNLATVGITADKKDCHETGKRRFLCIRQDGGKYHYMSWSKKDLIYVLAVTDQLKSLKPEFYEMKVK